MSFDPFAYGSDVKKTRLEDLKALRDTLPAATAPKSKHPELEAVIEKHPEDRASYRVYGDVLEGAGDPRGRLIALQDAALDRPADADVVTALSAHLARHEAYFLGGLASAVRENRVVIAWYMGFLRSVHIANAPTAQVLELIDTIAALPSCRFLRELTIAPHHRLDPQAIADRLVELGRLTTLAQLDIVASNWAPSPMLCDAFPRFGEAVATFEQTIASLPPIDKLAATGADRQLDWRMSPRFVMWQVQKWLDRFGARLATPDPVIGIEVDPSVFAIDGASACRGGRIAELIVPDRNGSVLVEGDLGIDGVLEQPFRSSPVIVSGDLRCRSLCTDGYLVVIGDLVVDDTFYGCCTNYPTIVFGSARIGSLLLDRNHHFGLHGALEAQTRLSDEEDGYEAIGTHLVGRGLFPEGELTASTLATRLRA